MQAEVDIRNLLSEEFGLNIWKLAHSVHILRISNNDDIDETFQQMLLQRYHKICLSSKSQKTPLVPQVMPHEKNVLQVYHKFGIDHYRGQEKKRYPNA